jgi:hypothetical protein
MTSPATRLTEEQLTELRTRAAAKTSPFVDPAQLNRVAQFVAGREEWATAITGRPFTLRAMTNLELRLLDLAAETEPAPPAPPRQPRPWEDGYVPSEHERADADLRAARATEWTQLRAALPVPVRVVHNYTSRRHTENHVQGIEHILVVEEVRAGRLHREVGRALCFTPSKRRDHRYLSLNDWDPGDDDRLPTCAQCLRIAYRLTDRAVNGALL